MIRINDHTRLPFYPASAYKTITVAGAVAGVGIEATSFRHGLVHHTLLELDVLLPDGEVARCTPDNSNRELFFGFPNS